VSKTGAAGAELARRTRAAQGLPATADDPVAIQKVAEIAAGARRSSQRVGIPATEPGSRTSAITVNQSGVTTSASPQGEDHVSS
jgi:hypothetical protein